MIVLNLYRHTVMVTRTLPYRSSKLFNWFNSHLSKFVFVITMSRDILILKAFQNNSQH